MDYFTLACCLHRPQQSTETRKVRVQCVADHADDDEYQREPAQVDLTFQRPVNGHEDIKPAFGKAKQRAVFLEAPIDLLELIDPAD